MRALGFDTETTDLIRSRFRPLKDQPHITEFFGMVMDGVPVTSAGETIPTVVWNETETFQSLFNPGVFLTPQIVKITGLTDDILRDEPKFDVHAERIKELIESCDIVFAHNLGFDRAMIDIEMERCGLKVNWPSRMICTVECTEHFVGRRLKLMELHKFLFDGEEFEGAHRAENDVRPMARCFKQLWSMGTIAA